MFLKDLSWSVFRGCCKDVQGQSCVPVLRSGFYSKISKKTRGKDGEEREREKKREKKTMNMC